MQVRCQNCGKSREVLFSELKKILNDKVFKCGNCESTYFKLEGRLLCPMKNAWFEAQSEIRCILMNQILSWGADVWDCSAKLGGCPDPVLFDNIPLQIRAGSFPFFIDNKYHVVGVKFTPFVCRFDSEQGKYRAREKQRRPLVIKPIEQEMLKAGGGVIVGVFEPLPKTIFKRGLSTGSEILCEKELDEKLRKPLGDGRLSYTVVIIDNDLFLRFLRRKLAGARASLQTLTAIQVRNLFPKETVEVPISFIKGGGLTDLVLEKLKLKV
jgi:hypothetical protein